MTTNKNVVVVVADDDGDDNNNNNNFPDTDIPALSIVRRKDNLNILFYRRLAGVLHKCYTWQSNREQYPERDLSSGLRRTLGTEYRLSVPEELLPVQHGRPISAKIGGVRGNRGSSFAVRRRTNRLRAIFPSSTALGASVGWTSAESTIYFPDLDIR